MLIFFQPWVIFVVGVMYFGLLLPIGLIGSLFPLRIRRRFLYPGWNVFSQVILRLGCLARFTINDRRSSRELGLHISNHQSLVDIPMVASKIYTAAMMKKEVVSIPLFGRTALHSGSIVVDRKNLRSRQRAYEQAKERLVDGLGLQTYPEGTRARDGLPKSFEGIKPRLLYSCYELGIPVIPISVYGSRNILTRRGLVRPFQKIGIIYHDLLFPRDFANREEFAEACWRRVVDGFYELQKELNPEAALQLQTSQSE